MSWKSSFNTKKEAKKSIRDCKRETGLKCVIEVNPNNNKFRVVPKIDLNREQCKDVIYKNSFDFFTILHFLGGLIIGFILLYYNLIATLTGTYIAIFLFIGWEFFECFVLFGKNLVPKKLKREIKLNALIDKKYCGDSHQNVVIDMFYDFFGYLAVLIYTFNVNYSIIFTIITIGFALFFWSLESR